MGKEGMGTANKLILAFVMLMIGAILIGVIANQTNSRTTYSATTDEQHLLSGGVACNASQVNASYVHTLTNAPTGWKSADCPITSFVITNSSGSAFTVTTDYVLTASTGTFTLLNTTKVFQSCNAGDNITLVDYKYCSDEYLNSSWGRSVLNLVAGFFAIALLLVAVALFYSVAKDTGIL